jgi:hypothetical protein
MQAENPPLSGIVRLYSLIVLLVFAFALSPLWIPEVVTPGWPWRLTPFTARFVGAIYTAFAWPMVVLLVVNRWSPGRLIFLASLAFIAPLTVVSLIHIERFNFSLPGTWLWWSAYPLSMLVIFYFLWRYRDLPPAGPAPSPGRRRFFRVQAWAFGLYGLAIAAVPPVATGFWPWPIDVFHAQIYSTVFFTAAAATWLLAGSAHRLDLLAVGLFQTLLGLVALAGAIVADAKLDRIDWSAPGTVIWIAGCLAIAALGLITLAAARRPGP